jgi:soluble cytochrome b562
MFKAHASVQDLQALLEKRYIYQFDNGVIVIKHWRMANALRKDRYTPTAFKEELAKLDVKDNGAYTWLPDGCQVVANRLPQDRIGKVSVEGININCASDNAQCKVSKKEIDDFFESIWKLYPNKKGKGQISDAKKKKLYEVGFDEMARSIDRYKKDLEKESDWRKPQNGSTFFNSGYVDYLDANYEPTKAKPQKKNSFNNFNQREYNFDELERDLLS